LRFKEKGFIHDTGFDIYVVSEIIAILALSTRLKDMKVSEANSQQLSEFESLYDLEESIETNLPLCISKTQSRTIPS
jgi:formyltetrahydrofolate synthetase